MLGLAGPGLCMSLPGGPPTEQEQAAPAEPADEASWILMEVSGGKMYQVWNGLEKSFHDLS